VICRRQLIFLTNQLVEKERRIQNIEELVKYFKHQRFSTSSEKVSVDQLGLFNESEEILLAEETTEATTNQDIATVKAHQRTTKPRVTIPEHLPREVIDYELPESEKVCPHDQTILKHIGTEDHEQLDIIPAQVKVIRHRRYKYTCPCCQKYHTTASKPKQPIEKGIASPGLLAYIGTQKYCDVLPLYRQSDIFTRSDITLSRANLANWMMRYGELVQPLINLLMDHIIEKPVVHMDETTVQVLNEPNKAAQSKSYMWLMACFDEQPAVVFHYSPSRQLAVPLQLLDDGVHTLMVDGYEGYRQACHDYGIVRLGYWAHARRKFVDAKKLQPKGKVGKADQAIAFIQTLYRVEKKMKDASDDERYRVRQEEAKPVIDKVQAWLQKNSSNTPPKSKIGVAFTYLNNQWPRLVRYLDNGAYPIDNNPAENAIRPFTVRQKNWLFSNSQAGAKASANLYSLVQTAKVNDLNPYDYLREVFTKLPNAQTIDSIESLLPWHIKL